jgi:hypothetical protein
MRGALNRVGLILAAKPGTHRGAPAVKCCKCGREQCLPYVGALPPPEVLRKKLAQMGYSPKGKNWVCDICTYATRGKIEAAPVQAKTAEPAVAPQTDLDRLEKIVAEAKDVLNANSNRKTKFDPRKLSAGLLLYASGGSIADQEKASGLSDTTIERWATRLGIGRKRRLDWENIELTEDRMNQATQMAGRAPVSEPAAQPPKVVPLRVLTAHQTAKLSIKLDTVFDPETGKYTSDWTDQKIAEHLDIPRANVTAFRDEAFGKLKVNPDLDKALEMLARMEDELSKARDQQEAIGLMIKRIGAGMKVATDMIAKAGG